MILALVLHAGEYVLACPTFQLSDPLMYVYFVAGSPLFKNSGSACALVKMVRIGRDGALGHDFWFNILANQTSRKLPLSG